LPFAFDFGAAAADFAGAAFGAAFAAVLGAAAATGFFFAAAMVLPLAFHY
jgi:hypothetical protein